MLQVTEICFPDIHTYVFQVYVCVSVFQEHMFLSDEHACVCVCVYVRVGSANMCVCLRVHI